MSKFKEYPKYLSPAKFDEFVQDTLNRSYESLASPRYGRMNTPEDAAKIAEHEWKTLIDTIPTWGSDPDVVAVPPVDTILCRRRDMNCVRIANLKEIYGNPHESDENIQLKYTTPEYCELVRECRISSDDPDSVEDEQDISVAIAIGLLDALRRTGHLDEALALMPHDAMYKLDASFVEAYTDTVYEKDVLFSMIYLVYAAYADDTTGGHYMTKYLLGDCGKARKEKETLLQIIGLLSADDREILKSSFIKIKDAVRDALNVCIDDRINIVRKHTVQVRNAQQTSGKTQDMNTLMKSGLSVPETSHFKCMYSDLEAECLDLCESIHAMHTSVHTVLYKIWPMLSVHTQKWDGKIEKTFGDRGTNLLRAIEVPDPYAACAGWFILLAEQDDDIWDQNLSTATLMRITTNLPWYKCVANDYYDYTYVSFISLVNIAHNEGKHIDSGDFSKSQIVEDGDERVKNPYYLFGVDNTKMRQYTPLIECETDEDSKDEMIPAIPGTKKYHVQDGGDNHPSGRVDLFAEGEWNRYDEKWNSSQRGLSYTAQNLPQLFYYGTDGLIMPRDSNKMSLAGITRAWISDACIQNVAADMILLAKQCDKISFSDIMDDGDNDESAIDIDAAAIISDEGQENERQEECIEQMKAELAALRAKNAELRQCVHDAEVESRKLNTEIRRLTQESESDKQELVHLRDTIYELTDGEDEEIKPVIDKITLPADVNARIVVFGGHDVWLRNIRALLPNVRFLGMEGQIDPRVIASADAVWFMYNHLSHKLFIPMRDLARKYNKPIYYFGYPGARNCAEQICRQHGIKSR